MGKHGLLDGPLAKESICVMAGYYQFFREILMAFELGGSFILLCDSRSPTFVYKNRNISRGLMPFLLSLIPDHLHPKIKVLYIQGVVAAIRETGRHDWIGEFEKKIKSEINKETLDEATRIIMNNIGEQCNKTYDY